MSKKLVIVESPNKIKQIQKYLGDDYIVRATVGHIIDLHSTPQNKLGIDIKDNFRPIYSVIPDKKDKLAAIVDAAKGASEIFIASDPDREGEAIAWHVASQLKKITVPIHRVEFKEITKDAVKKGISNPSVINQNRFDAQQARRVLDRLVGFMVSPFVINKLGPNLSAGRVQSVAIRMVVDREREIEAFVPEEYWPILAALAKPEELKESFTAKYTIRVTNKATAMVVKSDLEKDAYEVIEVVAQEKTKEPPPPLKTATLQQVASRKYGISSDRSMKAAQKLYESGLVTYIRTDSVRSAPEAIQAVREWIKEHGHDLPKKATEHASGGGQDAHEAIRPTSLAQEPSEMVFASEEERKVYTMIWERFVTSQMKPALYDTIAATIKSSSGHILKANGRALKYKGWLDLAKDSKEKDDKDSKLPLLKKGDKLVLVQPKIKAEQKFTQPPARFTEPALLEELEKKGIGRPSTYAAIMQKITDRSYVEKKKDTFFATEVGKSVVDVLSKFFDFMKYDYTAEMENKLDKIESGNLKYVDMMSEFFPHLKDQLIQADAADEQDYGMKCWVCNKRMRLRHGVFGYYMACWDYPDNCRTSRSCDIVDGVPVFRETHAKPSEEGTSCPKCSKEMIIRDGKYGKFYSCSSFPRCSGSRKLPSGIKCDRCSLDMYVTVFDGVSKLACTGYPDCRTIKDLPPDYQVNWIDPKTLPANRKNKDIEKILKTSRDVGSSPHKS